ncbi:MAG: DUF4159 domain-containing protein [Acidimicrobiia bacterium]|nr:DUF4159 domain-containing protein [Acidimicrobiia bacterium]
MAGVFRVRRGSSWTRPSWLVALALVAVAAFAADARQRGTIAGSAPEEYTPDGSGNEPYDGRFQFVRLRYDYGLAAFGRFGRLAPWAHDHPRADTHLMRILSEITLLRPRTSGSNTFALDDEALFQHPFAYMSEPGFWEPSPSEVEGLRAYLLKGGFVVFDDFRGSDWTHLQAQMKRVLPDHHFQELDGADAVFHAFFEMPDPWVLDPPYGDMPPSYWGVFEENDRRGRLMAVANVNNDLGEYWEFSSLGFVPVDLSNEAYKFGVNYTMYALMH